MGHDQRRVVVVLRRPVLEQAVRGVLRAHGWRVLGPTETTAPSRRPVPGAGIDGPVRVVDDERLAGGERSVLICEAAPVACAAALRRLVRGDVGAVVADERLVVLPDVLDALLRRRSILDLDIVALAALVPPLDPRQHAVLQGLLAGQSTREIATSAYVSVATVKRSVSQLYRLFGVRSSPQLARRATSLGYVPRRVTGPFP